MPRGASSKREREYNTLKKTFKRERRYPGREEEVAARIVNKQRAQFSETRPARAEDKRGASPDRDLPIGDYDHLTVNQVAGKLGSLPGHAIKTLERYERQHKNRKTLLVKFRRKKEAAVEG
ncbi:MAG TPA: hypothetical protein VE735_02405 [Gammaproteobacteria bacterium]|nr:hypothetical protein [Gammaproteobacteria bacterium]